MATEVAKHLDTDPTMLQFFRMQATRDSPGTVIRSHFEGQLKDLLQVSLNFESLRVSDATFATKSHCSVQQPSSWRPTRKV